MRILHVTAKYPPPFDGGLQRQVHGLAHALATEHDVGVVTMGRDRRDGAVEVFGGEPLYAALPHRQFPALARINLGLCHALVTACRRQDWDIVHAHDWMVAPAALMARVTLGKPVVASFHADAGATLVGPAEDRARRLEWEDELITVATRIFACSGALQRALVDRHPNAQVTHIPNGFWPHQFTAAATMPMPAAMRLLFVGRLVPYKGCQDVLYALQQLIKEWPGLELHIVGDGFNRSSLEQLVRTLGLHDRIMFRGWLTGDELVRAYQCATMLVVPSHEEAFGLVALEAMAAGTPVIATTVGAFPELIEHGRTGLLVKPQHPSQLAQQIDGLLRSPQWREAMASAAKEQVVPGYDWRHVARRMLAAYQDLLTSP
jgi:glycosyltransferase involved in cell wall biosynthesis